MNRYREMERRQQEEYNSFAGKHCFYAFDQKQFAEGMAKFGLDPENDRDRIKSIGAGGYVLADHAADLRALFNRHHEERQQAIDADPTGEGFVYEMFSALLADYEYSYTGDPEDALSACGLTLEEVMENDKLRRGLQKAAARYEEGD